MIAKVLISGSPRPANNLLADLANLGILREITGYKRN